VEEKRGKGMTRSLSIGPERRKKKKEEQVPSKKRRSWPRFHPSLFLLTKRGGKTGKKKVGEKSPRALQVVTTSPATDK